MANMNRDALQPNSTEQLLEMWSGADRGKYSLQELGVVLEILSERGVEVPLPGKVAGVVAGEAEAAPAVRRLPGKSNAVLRTARKGKDEIRFPKDGYIQPGRFEFKDWDDFFSYLSQHFGAPASGGGGVRGSLSRKGKYQRVDDDGNQIFTFGDPILDLVTNRHGLLIIGGAVHDLRAESLKAGPRRGGLRAVDLAPHHEALKRKQLQDAVLGEGNFVLVECDAENATLASRNPSTLDFWSGNARMRFRAWRTNVGIYFNLGAEIETWGGDFETAYIMGRYGEHLPMGSGQMSDECFVLAVDTDDDEEDDYVDEFEWGTGVGFTVPDGVRSFCKAKWRGTLRSGTVQKGSCTKWSL